MTKTHFPEMPLENWRATKNTLHLWFQIVGKIRLATHPPLNHWWHVTLYVSPRGVTTRSIPYKGESFEIEFDFVDHKLVIRTSSGSSEDFSLYDGLTVADFYDSVFKNLAKVGVNASIRPTPYEAPSTTPFPEDTENKSYDREYVERFHRILVQVNELFERFRGRFNGKSTPVHLFWHSFDLALTRFSGKEAPPMPDANEVARKAYSHEVISFGFWFGDDNVPAPAFYSYTAPEPDNLTGQPLNPAAARWDTTKGAMAILMYDDVRRAEDAEAAVLDFLESAYRAGATAAEWDVDAFKTA